MKSKFALAAMLMAAVLAMGAAPALALVRIVPAPPIVRPPAPAGYAYQWVVPVLRTVRDQVWIPRHVEMVQDWVEVSPGRYEMVMRQNITPGHYETTTRQVVASEGYWQLVRIDPPLPVPVPVVVVVNPGTVGVEGYGSGPGEDLSKFSGLREWPGK